MSELPAVWIRRSAIAELRTLPGYQFSTTAAHRVEADTDLGNTAGQRARELGACAREAVRRGYAWRDGSWHDTVLYAVLRGEL